MKLKLKKYRYFIYGLMIVIGIVFYSCFEFYQSNFSYVETYNKIKKNCYEKKNIDDAVCTSFYGLDGLNEEAVEQYIINNNPKLKHQNLDVITMTCEIVENTIFRHLQIFSPLIILFVVIGSLQKEFSSGNFKNYFLRQDYKKYMKKSYRFVLLSATLMPVALILIFLISGIFTGFNFDTHLVDPSLSVYDDWKYNHFILYGFTICVIQYLISLLYANLGVICIRKNKNQLVSIMMGFLLYMVVNLVIYLVLYVLIINRLLGFKELTEYFNIMGYWFFDQEVKLAYVVLLSFLFQFISFIYLWCLYRKKENLVLAYEKQVS